MSRRTLLTISTAIGLSCLYLLYARFVKPVIDPQIMLKQADIDIKRPPPPSRPRSAIEAALAYLPSQPWTVDAEYQLHANDAFIYAKERDSLESDQAIRFKPFAMIWQTNRTEQGKQPITVVSEMAVVRFASKLNWVAPTPGRVVGGQLQRKVRITGPDGLVVVGKNFFFEEAATRIWSDDPVWFRYGPHQGRAEQGVQIDLIAAEPSEDDEMPRISGIDKIHLLGDVSMAMVLDADETQDEPVRVQIRSKGRFEYAVGTNIATFEDDVVVVRPTDREHVDSLHCDRLTLEFEPKTPRTDQRGTNQDQRFRGIDGPLVFRRLRAEGLKGRKAELVSEANQLTAWMNTFIYDRQTKVALLSDEDYVEVVQKSSRLLCPEMTLLHGDGGKIATAWCRGKGHLEHVDAETGEIQFSARWLKQLKKYTDPQTGLDVIELEQQAVVRQPQRNTGLAAEFIKLWLQQVDPTRTGDRDVENVEPKFLLALKNVDISSPQLQGKTQRLHVLFEAGSWAKRSPHTASRGLDARRGLQSAVRRVAHRRQESPGLEETPQSDRSNGGSTRGDAKHPLKIVADRMTVRALPGNEFRDAQVAEIWTEGNVHVQQQRGPDQQPMQLAGERLHLQNRSEQDQILHIYGSPAHIRDRGMHIEGREIHFDRNRNQAWVSGAGLLELPVKRGLDGEVLNAPQPLDVWWQERMTFDGQAAQFFGNVRAELNDNRMQCQQMQVLLKDKLLFAEERPQEDPDILSIRCSDGVEFTSYEYEGNKTVGIRQANFGKLTMNLMTGHTEAQGPGWIKSWGRGRGKRAGLSPIALVQANQPLQSESSEWEYTRVDFVGKAVGNLKQRDMTFHDRVQIVHGPVGRPLETIDPDRLDRLPKDVVWMRCDRMRVTQHEKTETQPGFDELLADGNAELKGRSFHARADSISYDESKGFYMLRSRGNRKATIWHQTTPGGKRSRFDAQRIEFIPSRKHLKLHHTTGLDGLR